MRVYAKQKQQTLVQEHEERLQSMEKLYPNKCTTVTQQLLMLTGPWASKYHNCSEYHSCNDKISTKYDYLIDFLLTHFSSYQDQLEMVSEKVAQEKKETAIREKAQRETSQRLEREIRRKMESDVERLHDELRSWEEDCAHFRQLDAEMLVTRLQRGLLKAVWFESIAY